MRKRLYTLRETKTRTIYLLKKYQKSSKHDPELPSLIKNLVVLCNSLSTTYLQRREWEEANEVLQTTTLALNLYSRIGNHIDKLWVGKVVYLCLKGYLTYKTKDYKECLKSLYESLKNMISIRENLGKTENELGITANILTFMCLWKMGMYEESREYLEETAGLINNIVQENTNNSSLTNLYGLVVMSLAGLTIKLENEYDKAVELCKSSLTELKGETLIVRGLIEDFLIAISEEDFIGSLEAFKNNEVKKDFLVTSKYENLVFETLLAGFSSQLVKMNMEKQEFRSKSKREDQELWWKNPRFIEQALKTTVREITPEPVKRIRYGSATRYKRPPRANCESVLPKSYKLAQKMELPFESVSKKPKIGTEPILVELSGVENRRPKSSELGFTLSPMLP